VNDRAPLPPTIRQRAFLVGTALGSGVNEHRLRADDLVRPHWGVRSPRVQHDVDDRARELALVLGADQALSHATAAQLWQIPLPSWLRRDPRLHITTLGDDRTVRRPGVVGHRTRNASTRVIHVDGIPVTDPLTTLVALGSVLTLDDLIVAGDALVGELRLATVDELRAAVDRAGRVRGARTLRAALDEVRPGSRSPGETRTRLVLTRNGLPEPELNHDVVVSGRWVACVDLAYPETRVAIEYDSDLHRTDADAYRKDLTRSERLKDVDWWPVRSTAFDVGAGSTEFVARVRRLLAAGMSGTHRPDGPGPPNHRVGAFR
jgi:hypothetical protein